MANHEKYEVGERVEMYCPHLENGQLVTDWLEGRVAEADYRMVAVRFEVDVYTSNGWPAPGRLLWCTHGSRNLRRAAVPADKSAGQSRGSNP